jgi:cysteinyl-tRNA synthetase
VRQWNRKKEFIGLSTQAQKYKRRFTSALKDDLQMPRALAILWEMIDDNQPSEPEKYQLINDWDKVLGLNLDKLKMQKLQPKTADKNLKIFLQDNIQVSENVQVLVEKRAKLRESGNWQEADRLRQQIEAKDNIKIEDTTSGTVVKKNVVRKPS